MTECRFGLSLHKILRFLLLFLVSLEQLVPPPPPLVLYSYFSVFGSTLAVAQTINE